MPGQENQETEVIETSTTVEESQQYEEIPSQEVPGDEMQMDQPQVVVPVEIREMTRFENEKGHINIIHEITMGDLLVSTSLVAILIFMVLSRFIRR